MVLAQGRQVYFSIHHPGGRSKAAVAGTALVRPLGFCMLPVMIGALFSMLQGFAALPYLTLGFPIALCCAAGWTWLHVRRLICEIHIYGDSVAIRTLHEAAHPASDIEWKRILAITTKADHADITLGLTSIRLDQDVWPEWFTVVEALRHAKSIG